MESFVKIQTSRMYNLLGKLFPTRFPALTDSLTVKYSLIKLWNSISLIIGRFSSSGLGFLTWLITARLYPANEVGIASGIISAMMLCVQISLVGLNSAIIALYPRYKENPSRLMNTAVNITILASLLAGLTFLVLAGSVFQQLGIVTKSWIYVFVFLLVTVLATVNTLMDGTSIVTRNANEVIWRNILFGLTTIGFIALFPFILNQTNSILIVAGWALASVASVGLGIWQLFRSLKEYRYRLVLDRAIGKELIHIGTRNYLLTLAERAPNWLMPIAVTELLSPAQNAYWYTLWMMAWVIYIIPISIGNNLFADISHEPDKIHQAIRFSTRLSLILGVAGGALAFLLAHIMLSFMGDDYSDAGTMPLRILIFGVIPFIFIQTYYAISRGKNHLKEATWTGVISGLIGVSSATLAGLKYGLSGMAVAWLATQIITGIWAFFRIRKMQKQSQEINSLI